MATTFEELIEELAQQQTPGADQYLEQLVAQQQQQQAPAPAPMPMRRPEPPPEELPMPERREVAPTTVENAALAVSSLGEGFKGADLDRSKVERAVELSQTRYCGVSTMLGKTAEITHTITIEA